jgi:hypothetical protein
MLQTRALFLSSLAAVALVGCPSGNNQPDAGPAPTINSFTATPPLLTVGGGTVTLAWDVTGASTLSIDNGVGSVSPPTTGSIPVLVGKTTTFTLTATNTAGSSTKTASVAVPVPDAGTPITVNGKVVDNNGQPVAGATVIISGDGGTQTVVSGSNGGFSAPNVWTPYNATLVESSQAIEYQGLTRSDPSLTAFVYLTNNRSGMIAGSFTGGTYPETSGYDTVFLFDSPQTTWNLFDQPSGSYSATVRWPGPTSTTGTLYALQRHFVSGLPADYPGYGTQGGVVVQDTGTTSQNVGLSSVTSGSLSGTVSAPVGYTVGSKAMSLQVSPTAQMSLVYDATSGGAFSYVTPAISNTQIIVTAAATSNAGEYSAVVQAGLSANSTVALSIPASPTLIAPVDGGVGVTTATPFSWTAYPGGVYQYAASSTSGQTLYVLTAATTVTLPNLTDAGLPLPASTAYSWYVVGLAPVANVDLLAAPGGINILTFSLSESISATRTFTTGP